MKRVEVRSSPDRPKPPGIAPWKFFAGLMIHIGVPAYLLLLVVTLVVYVLEHGTTDGLFSLLPQVSLYFITFYASVTVAGTGVAALAGLVGRTRRNRQLTTLGKDPAIRSRNELSHAVGLLGAMKDDPAIESALHAIADAAWHHDDERYQQVSRDLDKAAGTYAGAHASARGEQQREVSRLAAETLRHVAQKLDDLAQDTGIAATRNAQTMAGYIASKYGDDLDVVR
ncbi:MAG: hypothetical protein JWN66_1592 [Sphingomonas bacterium]|uniref:hypothetical protein n=1 Tax=Sphingomonas bacterium TaxID=1895847 RepID=UPI002604406B|nr:hypothetical protein [Sphingomonas bacterium]MDB5704476.1 hypothetical protein [Sphingomonas bacterium]